MVSVRSRDSFQQCQPLPLGPIGQHLLSPTSVAQWPVKVSMGNTFAAAEEYSWIMTAVKRQLAYSLLVQKDENYQLLRFRKLIVKGLIYLIPHLIISRFLCCAYVRDENNY